MLDQQKINPMSTDKCFNQLLVWSKLLIKLNEIKYLYSDYKGSVEDKKKCPKFLGLYAHKDKVKLLT